MNKRDFVLGACAAVAAGAGQADVGRADVQLQPYEAGRLAHLPDLITDTGFAAWSRYAGESFDSLGLDAPLVLRSVEPHHLAPGAEQFTLVFASAPGRMVESAVLRLRHKSTGQRMDVFLQNAGPDANGVATHRAEFNVLA